MEFKFTGLDDVEVVDATREIKGYASVFGGVDSYNDTVVPGAYKQSVASAPARGFRMLYQHNPDHIIGRWKTVREDGKGLYVEGNLTPGHSLAEDIYASLKAGHVDGLSIGYRVPPGGSTKRADGVRELKTVVLREISVVGDPADASALVEAVKASDLQFREFRTLFVKGLREQGVELSRTEAEAFMEHGFKGLKAMRDAGGEREPDALKSALLDAIRNARN